MNPVSVFIGLFFGYMPARRVVGESSGVAGGSALDAAVFCFTAFAA